MNPKGKNEKLRKKLCDCIKSVRTRIQVRGKRKATRKNKESAAIGVCVKSVLQTRGKTIKKFSCGAKGNLETQPFSSTKE